MAYSKQLIEKVKKLYLSGKKHKETAKILEINIGVVKRIVKKSGLKKDGAGKFSFVNRDEKKVKELYRMGKSFDEIELKTGIASAIIVKIVKKHNLKRDRKELLQHQGENSYLSRLKQSQVIGVYFLTKRNISQADIANYFQVNQGTISRIIKGKTWRYLKEIREKIVFDEPSDFPSIQDYINKLVIHNRENIHYPTARCLHCEEVLPCSCMLPKIIET